MMPKEQVSNLVSAWDILKNLPFTHLVVQAFFTVHIKPLGHTFY
jgi:hypothetical protein